MCYTLDIDYKLRNFIRGLGGVVEIFIMILKNIFHHQYQDLENVYETTYRINKLMSRAIKYEAPHRLSAKQILK